MVVGNAYLHLYIKFSEGIFHKTMEETSVEGVAFYHH
jgi:hypothetical protein